MAIRLGGITDQHWQAGEPKKALLYGLASLFFIASAAFFYSVEAWSKTLPLAPENSVKSYRF